MLYKNRHKIFLSGIYFGWLISLIVWVPAGIYAAISSLAIIYLLTFFLSYAKVVVASLIIALVAVLGVLLNVNVVYSANPSWVLFHVLAVVVAVFFYMMIHDIGKSKSHTSNKTDDDKDASERQKLVALVNSMADGVVATDQNQKVTIYNGAALDVLNVNVSLEGQELSRFLPLYTAENKKVDIFKLAHKSRTSYVTRDLRLKYSDNEFINLYLSIAPVSVGYGQKSTLGYIILIRDITKEKSLEEERDEFISVVSHELRTPITVAEGAISNAQYIAEKETVSKGVTSSLNEAHKSAVFLADMINDLSMLSRAERGQLQVDPESIEIPELLESLRRDYEIQAQQKGLQISVAKLPPIKPINSAPLYVKEILQNFITNSIKYTEKGSITLSAVQTEKGVDVLVKDTGIGVSKSDQKKLFEKFFRSEDFRTRQSSGTGLGLYVTAKLAHLIGATIDVESEINVGSEFTISIPNIEAHHRQKQN